MVKYVVVSPTMKHANESCEVTMRLEKLSMPKDIHSYCLYVKNHYAKDRNYRDYVTPVIREVFTKQTHFSKSCDVQGYKCFSESGETLGMFTFLVHSAYAHVLQIVFLEYENQVDILEQILQHAKNTAQEKGLKRITIGLNCHVNYGLGLSHSNEAIPSFGSPFTKPYYIEHCRSLKMQEKTLTTFDYPFEDALFPLATSRLNRLSKEYTFSYMTSKNYDKSIALYTELNNACFLKHDFFFKRTATEDVELFKDLKFFLESGSLIFAHHGDKPIGFLLWYPDWSQLMKPHETLGLLTFVKRLFLRKRVKRLKLVEWAVIPEYSKRGIPIGLLYACYNQVKSKGYTECITSWILDENVNSNTFGRRWANPYEYFSVFDINLINSDEASHDESVFRV
jgi:hypothetical protein